MAVSLQYVAIMLIVSSLLSTTTMPAADAATTTEATPEVTTTTAAPEVTTTTAAPEVTTTTAASEVTTTTAAPEVTTTTAAPEVRTTTAAPAVTMTAAAPEETTAAAAAETTTSLPPWNRTVWTTPPRTVSTTTLRPEVPKNKKKERKAKLYKKMMLKVNERMRKLQKSREKQSRVPREADE